MIDQCYARASDVDHILPRAFGGTDDEHNLQALCSRHHKRKTAVQSSGWGRG
jgi:5-methylcytosine-specific restriction protein A